MSCPASLHLLPQEILDEIIHPLSLVSLVRLLSCNKTLYRRISPILYSRESARDQAMMWACKRGYVAAIRRLVSNHRASVSTVHIHWPGRTWSRSQKKWIYIDGSAKVLTLCLAASHRQVDAFRVLLELGGRIDIQGLQRGSVHRLLNAITQPKDSDWEIMRLFYDAQLHTQAVQERGGHALPLLRLVGRASRTPPANPVQLLLDLGSDPNTLQQPCDLSRRMVFTPLTAVMSQHHYDRTEVLGILLKSGAEIHGSELNRPVNRARHIPIFVAAESMAQEGTKCIEWCLKHKADINQPIFLFDQLYYNGEAIFCTSRKKYYTATPALAYIQSLHRKAFETDSKYSALHPLQGLVYLISHGATIDPPPDRNQTRQLNPVYRRHVASPWCIELLIWRWGLAKAEKSPAFRTMLRYLIHHSVSHGHAGEALARCETAYTRWEGAYSLRQSRKWSPERRDPKEVLFFMRAHLLDCFVKELKFSPTTLLQQYIVARGQLMDQEEETTYAVIEYLLADGGDINAAMADDSCTALHRLCEAYHHMYKTTSGVTFDLSHSQNRFLTFLVQKGADGSIVIGGRTAWDFLLEDLTRYRYLLLEMARIVGWKGEQSTVAS